jgi:hypothetical protein
MTTSDTSRKPDRSPAGGGMVKSIFPTFDVNVPMPRDTAIPGSYNQPPPQYSSDEAASEAAGKRLGDDGF